MSGSWQISTETAGERYIPVAVCYTTVFPLQ